MKPNETQEEFDEVSEELKKREDAVRCWEMHDIHCLCNIILKRPIHNACTHVG